MRFLGPEVKIRKLSSCWNSCSGVANGIIKRKRNTRSTANASTGDMNNSHQICASAKKSFAKMQLIVPRARRMRTSRQKVHDAFCRRRLLCAVAAERNEASYMHQLHVCANGTRTYSQQIWKHAGMVALWSARKRVTCGRSGASRKCIWHRLRICIQRVIRVRCSPRTMRMCASLMHQAPWFSPLLSKLIRFLSICSMDWVKLVLLCWWASCFYNALISKTPYGNFGCTSYFWIYIFF